MREFLTLRTLDRRFTAYPFFQHMIEVRPQYTPKYNNPNQMYLQADHSNFFKIREWLWEAHGPSKELKHWIKHNRNNWIEGNSHNQDWCWDTDYYQHRIYLSEAALSSVLLTFG